MKKQVYFVLSCALSIIIALNTMTNINVVYEAISSTFSSPNIIYVMSSVTIVLNAIIAWIAIKGKIMTNRSLVCLLSLITFLTGMNIFTMVLAFVNVIVLLFSKPNEQEKEELEKTNPKNLKVLEILQRDKAGYIKAAVIFLLYAAILIGTNKLVVPRTAAILLNLGVALVFIPLSFWAFGKTYKRDFKELKENFTAYKRHITKSYLILLIFYFAIVLTINALTGNSSSENQTQINKMPLWFSMPLAVIYAPIVEEAIFRGSLRRFIKNNVVFIIISALLFGGIHITDEASFKLVAINIIPYAFIGFMLAKTYTKTNNLLCSTTIHCMHNLIGCIAIVISKYLIQ